MNKYKLWLTLCCLQQVVYSANAQSVVDKYNFSIVGKTAKVYTTAKNTALHLSFADTVGFTPQIEMNPREAYIFVDPSKTFQTIIGIGGALTDAAAETFYKLPKNKQQQILSDYFDEEKGIGYTLARTHIQSCDFSSETYSYVDSGDAFLKTFNVNHDREYRIPFIKEAIKAAGGKLTLFASPWSPPGFMKDNKSMLHGGKLEPAYYQSWANFFVKFVKVYEHDGIPIWGLTVQNEPMANTRWETCLYTPEEERDFVKNYLGPTLRKEGMTDKKLMIWDHNRDMMYQYASTILKDTAAAKYIWGTAFHWYGNNDFDNVARLREAFQGTNLMFTEGCNEKYDLQTVNDWKWGERYGRSIISDLNNGISGWTDWNILLDQSGGPNHVGNLCFAPIHANTHTGDLTYMSSFYYIGHFSKFIRPGAKRVISSSNRDALQATAFLNVDNKLVVVVLNLTDDSLPYNLWVSGKAAKTISLPHSISTFVME